MFDYIVALLVMLNALLIGLQVDHLARSETTNVPLAFRIGETCFAVIFTSELALQLSAHGVQFFRMKGREWNVLDCLLVASQLFEQFLAIFVHGYESDDAGTMVNFSFLRLLRILRLVRVIRLIRVLRLVSELRTLVMSILTSMKSLVWTMVLLMFTIYLVAVYMTQLVTDHVSREDASGRTSLRRYFGTLDRSILSLFQSITGGKDWDDMLHPLVTHISPIFAIIFSMYIAFVVIAMLNVITGVFVESALKSAKADNEMLMIGNMREVFLQADSGMKGAMSWMDFKSQLDKPLMQGYFKAIDVDISEAAGLFRLLDLDNSGSIDSEEFLSGCLRLKGGAKALDVNLLLHEVKRFSDSYREHARRVEKQLQVLRSAGTKPTDRGSSANAHHDARTSSGDALSVPPLLCRQKSLGSSSSA